MFEITVRNNVSKKLYIVYFLNVVDWIFTRALLSTGLFYEANPITRIFISSIGLGLLIKCIVPFCIILLCVKSMRILEFAQLKIADMIVSFALTVYIAIILDHIINFILLLTV